MTMYRITLDTSLCSGFGSCVDAAPELFRLDGGGVARVLVAETDNPAALEAAGSCPMGAILVEEVAAA
jgi:ferredoxin